MRSTAAVEAIFEAKGRPSDNPLIVHIAHRDQLDSLVTEVNEAAEALIEAFWPGPLTIVLPVKPGAVSPRVTAGLDTVVCACRITRLLCSCSQRRRARWLRRALTAPGDQAQRSLHM